MRKCQYPGCENAALEGSNYCADHRVLRPPPRPRLGRRSGAARPSPTYGDVRPQVPSQTAPPVDHAETIARLNRALTKRTKRRKRK
jgi:hypothetical protein